MKTILGSAGLIGVALALAAPAQSRSFLPMPVGGHPLFVEVQYSLPETYSVRNLQEGLNRLGHDAGRPDGVAGPRTRAAIQEFQSAQGLAVTGRATPALYDQVRSATERRFGSPAPAAARAPAPMPPTASRDLVTAIQSELRQSGYAVDAVSGTMDDTTRAAIRDFQADAGLPVTGEPSDRMLAHLRSTAGQQNLQQRRRLVRQLQEELTQRGYEPGPADGTFTPRTRTAIRTFQSDANLQVTGQPSRELLAEMGERPDRRARRDRAAPEAAQASDPGLIRQVQSQLNARGYAVGTPDGVMGDQTRAAIRDFQQRVNLPVTGEPSVSLLASLQRSDPAASPTEDARRQQALITEVQRELMRRGYDVGAEGQLDVPTETSVRTYQRDAGLPPDGRVNQELLNHIRTSDVRARTSPGAAAGQMIDRLLQQRQ